MIAAMSAPPDETSTVVAPPEPVPATSASRPQRGDIQGLRALAVLIVCLCHAGMPFFDGGYVGVDVFFVISGFLITGILMRSLARNGTFSLADFYARRARRILPAAALVLVVTVAASALALSETKLKQVLEDVVWAGLFGANIHFARIDDDYFASDSFASPVRHYWSLAAEEQFYVFWPILLLLVVHLVRKHKGITGRPAMKYVVYTLIGVTALSLAWCVIQTLTDPSFAYYAPMTRAWELGAGALLAVIEPRLRRLKWTQLNALSLLGLSMIAYATIAYSEDTSFPGHAALVPVLGAVLVIAGGCTPAPRGASRALDRGPLRWLGDISYSLYLWHWPFLVLPELAGMELSLLDRVNLLLAAAAVATASQRWVEQPFREAAFWQAPRLRSLALWPAAAGLVLAAVFAAQDKIETTPTVAPTLDIDPSPTKMEPPKQGEPRPEPPTASEQIATAVQKAAARARKDEAIPTKLAPPLLELENANWDLPERCWADTDETHHQICTFGDPQGEKTLLLLGDSHMGVWVQPLAAQAKERGWKVRLLLKTGCPPIDVPMWRTDTDRHFSPCDDYRTWALGKVAELAPDRIAITGYTRQALSDRSHDKQLADDDGPTGTRAYEAGMERTIEVLARVTKDVVVIGDTNTLSEDSVDCLGDRGADLGSCARNQAGAIARRSAAWGRLAEAAGGDYVSLYPWLCADETCPLVVGNTIVYFDDNHLTTTYAAALGPALADELGL